MTRLQVDIYSNWWLAKPAELGIPVKSCWPLAISFGAGAATANGIIFVGGGYISFEFAHVAARGAQPDSARGDFEHFWLPDLVAQLRKPHAILASISTEYRQAIEKGANNLIVHAAAADGDEQTFAADMVS